MHTEAKNNQEFSVLHTSYEYRESKDRLTSLQSSFDIIIPALDAVGTVESLESFEGYIFCPLENTNEATAEFCKLYGCSLHDVSLLGTVTFSEIRDMLEAASLRINRDIDFGTSHKILEGEFRGLYVTPLLIRESTGDVICSYPITGVDRIVDVPPQEITKEKDPYEDLSDDFLIDIRSEALKQGVRRVLVLDGSYLVMRSIFTYDRLYMRSNDTFVGGRLGFYYFMLKMRQLYPEYEVHVVFDAMKRRSFFNRVSKKKNRLGKAVDQTWDWCVSLAKACGMGVYHIKNKEARDVIASLASTLRREEDLDEMLIVTKDEDFSSLVSKSVFLYLPKISQRDQDRVFRLNDVKEKYGVNEPHKVLWLKSFMGDATVNIPSISQAMHKPVRNQEVLDLINKVDDLEDLRDRAVAGEFGSSIMSFVSKGKFDKHLKKLSFNLELFEGGRDSIQAYENEFNEDAIQSLLEQSDFYSELEYLSKSLVILKGLWIR